MEQNTSLIVNGQSFSVTSDQQAWSLLRFLREALHLTGTKQSCDSEGACGACTVLVNKRPRRACLTKLSAIPNAQVETIESLLIKDGQSPHPLLQTVIQDGIFQCGYCAPGALLSAKALLDENPTPSQKEVEKALTPIICRCAGLNRMDRSVMRAAQILRGEIPSTWSAQDTANEERMLSRLTGKTPFTADLSFPGMLYARALRAGQPHARLKKLDLSQARQMTGILAVLTAQDIPGINAYGSIVPDQVVFCDEKHEIKHVGDVLALVVGENQEQVTAALAQISFELEPLPVISSTLQALEPDPPVLHERLRQTNPQSPNILKQYQVRKGDTAKGFEEADVIVEEDYEVPFVEHAYMELECSIAVPEPDGTLTIYCGTQGPTEDRHQVANALGVEEENIRIAHMFMGGGFGGKEDIAGQIHAALAARVTGRPVKVQWSRAESLMASTKRHAMKMHYKTGAKKDGSLVAAEVKIIGDTGPYASVGEAVLFRACVFACGPYILPNAAVDSLAVHTNNAISGAFRGYGSPQVAFASELQMQKLADALGMDPFEFRLKNALDLGQSTITGDVMTVEVGVEIKACLNAVQEALHKTPLPEILPDEKLGIGLAAAYKNVGFGSNLPDFAGAKVSLEPGGIFLVRHGATDMGQGINEVMAAITAKIMEVPISLVKVHTADTKYDPPGGMTTASRQTFISGNAVLQASQRLREQLWQVVSEEFSVPVSDLKLQNGVFTNQQNGRGYISLQELAAHSARFETHVIFHAPQTQPPPIYTPDHPIPQPAPMHFAYDFGVQAAIVAVNTQTGAVRVLKIIAAHDVGKTISRKNVIGQIEGAVVQGVGYALSEQFLVENGIPKTTKFKDLGLLRFRDLPEIEPIIIEEPHPKGPFGAKGMGELTITPTAPAIINAIHDAVGVWINSLPATNEKILEALQKRKAA
jgi:CO/xanthine dehydrogenase Mo-binding subunit/aerobic-type carbon monoxide dehydrogenase small subunit (CoxS/CutS family)